MSAIIIIIIIIIILKIIILIITIIIILDICRVLTLRHKALRKHSIVVALLVLIICDLCDHKCNIFFRYWLRLIDAL